MLFQLKKDFFTWDDSRTMSLVVKSLRGNALVWYHSLKRSNINTSMWMDFKRVFITSYVSEKTSPSDVVDLTDLKQGQDEKVLDFYTRVTTVTKEIIIFVIPATKLCFTYRRFSSRSRVV